ncbi:MAG: nuclear transport factor 2 family protein [Candidatus Abyssobacteria bacterium SURF_5]|uniref:Nuclear transport factor 2 family protein n=1 Tax=Abyssobacteria bacterium (strain SURF_5) TaxID=2093360 RepID=A0A3A4NXB9_ABYX5|nr:MAG: nuclear transport factor 2 family protein [Candidatus Abyssubacteria bacterium SURF_5]
MEPTAAALAEKLRDAYNNFAADEPETLDLFSQDVVYTDPRFPPFEGKEALRNYLQQLAGENRALQVAWEFTNLISEGEHAAVEWKVRSGVDFGGKPLEFSGAAFFRARAGKICYYRGYWDTSILQRLME